VTWYSRADYGSNNPNAGRNANGDTAAWGGYQWQNCPPSSLLGTTDYTSKFGQRLRVQVRKEAVQLMTLMFQIADMHDYCVYSNYNGENWGPWGMDCRPVSGTSTPSGHSKGLSMDWNAPFNPYSYTFQSDMPPQMVWDIEACGWYWGGRYEGQKYDAMHYGYCFKPADVAGHVTKAQGILAAGGGGGTDMPLNDDDINRIADRVWSQIITEAGGAPAWKVLLDARDVMAGVPAILAPQTVADAIGQTRNDAAAIKANLGA
jgi:D-alanyl-D-alanine carboxypeptidase